MSDEQPSPTSDENTSLTTADSNPDSGLIGGVPAVVEERLEAALRDLPEPKQELIRHTMHEVFMAIVQRGTAPSIDAETARILAGSADKEHEFRFKYLTQKQQDTADDSVRQHELEKLKFRSRVKIFWPILITVLVVVVGALSAGVYLAATGSDILGTGLVTGTAFAVAGYLAGCGTSGFFKE